jgi:predicted TIM-barrel fold metal-dependent hydrolase
MGDGWPSGVDMDIVDTQVHLGPGGAAEKVAAMDALGIKSVLIDEWWGGWWETKPGEPAYRVGDGAIRTTSPTAELASWTYPGRFSYLVRVDPRDPAIRSVARFASDSTYARALRITTPMPRSELTAFAEGAYDTIFAAASEFGLPVFVSLLGHTELLNRYLEKFVGVKVIIDHCGMPPNPSMTPMIARMEGLPDSEEYWSKLAGAPLEQSFEKVLRMAKWSNVALKWAHAPSRLDAAGYPNNAARPFLRKALNAFGAERIMWASDVTVNPTGETWAELLFAIKDNPELTAEERDYVLGRSARTWLAWDA